MAEKKRNDGVCGVYCGQCPNGNGRVQFFAQELKRLIDTARYDWTENAVKSFSFSNFRKGLEWFANYSHCPMCFNIPLEKAHCPNKKCAFNKNLDSCLLCDEYVTCKDTEYQRGTYPFVIDNYKRVKEVGMKRYLKEEEDKARAGVDLMGHLERRCCKIVKLE